MFSSRSKRIASQVRSYFVSTSRPSNVGILAMEVYIPNTYVNQTELETFDGAGAGKYTAGLGQSNMSFCNEREDVNSICLTALQSLIEKYKIAPESIGRLEVGTESRGDKSKAVKTHLLQLFGKRAEADIEGVDSTNACYGGTAALFNSLAWVESSAWDGRYAVAVCGDVAVYEPGAARPTGGAGAVAMLIGPEAPLAFEPAMRTSYVQHAYDFYKPNAAVEYPIVDGKLSISCYLRAIDNCYTRYADRLEKKTGKSFTVDDIDYSLFHSPFNKLVQKSFGRMAFNDFKRKPDSPAFAAVDRKLLSLSEDESYTSKDAESTFVKMTQNAYNERVLPSCLLPKQMGNSYTGTLYTSLASLIANKSSSLADKRLTMFSYGSGLTSTMFAVNGRNVNGNNESRFTLDNMAKSLDLENRLANRVKKSPEEFTEILKHREINYGKKSYVPTAPTSDILPGTFVLTKVDDLYRKTYERV